MSFRFLSIFAIIFSVTLYAAEARRGFSSGGSGSGSYDNTAPTASWDLSSTPDADCIAVYGSACASLTPAQIEEVSRLTADAQAANYTNHNDYLTANTFGYGLNAADGTQWTDAKSPGADNSGTDNAWNTDCDAAFSSTGGCDAITEAQFSSIDDATTGRVPAVAAGYDSYNAWQTASDLGYEINATDAALWGEANDGSVSAAACDAEFPGKTCNQLTKASFENAKSANALITAKIAKVNANTLTSADLLTDLGLSVASSALSSPILTWQLRYLETVLGTSNSTTKSDWQTTLDNYSTETASKWYVYQIATSSDTSGTYATSNATQALLDACSLSVSSANSALGPATDSQIASYIRSASGGLSSLSGSPTDTQLKDFLTEAVGFGDGTTYADFNTATVTNSWDADDYKSATGQAGWTNSGADRIAFAACKASTDTATGGASSCTTGKSAWSSLSSLASASDPSDLTTSDIEGILAAVDTADSDNAFGDLTALTSVETDYITACMGSTVSSSAMKTCVTAATPTSVPVFNIAKKIDGDYSAALSTTDLTNAGIDDIDTGTGDEALLTFLNSNTCGTNGTSACSAALGNNCGSGGTSECGTASLVSSGTSATQAQILAYVKSAARSYTQKLAQAAQLPAKSGKRCSSISVAAPAPCGVNPAFTCTGVGGWTYTSNSGTGTLSKQAPITGNLWSKVKIQRKAWWGGSTYTRTISRSVSLSAANNSNTSYAYGNTDYGLSPTACKKAQQACTSAGGTILTWNNLPSGERRNNTKFFYPDSNVTSGWTRYGEMRRQNKTTEDITLQSNGFFPGNNSKWWNHNSSTTSWGNSYCYVRCRTQACN